MFNRSTLFAALCLAATGCAAAQGAERGKGAPASEPVAVQQVRPGLYQASGGVGNAFFVVGTDEVLVIDAKMTAEAARQMFAEIKRVTDKPVRRVVLTHSDPDHVNGLAGFPPGLTIIAHASARKDMVAANATAAAKLPLPSVTFRDGIDLFVGDIEVRLLHFGAAAHTHGDIVAYIPSLKAAVVGDLVFVGRDPLIHAEKNGSSFGLVAVLKQMLTLDADVFYSGHADGQDKKAVAAMAARIEDKQTKVKALVEQGKTLAEVKTALDESAGQPGGGAGRFPTLVETIYRELTEQKAKP
jgi:cyclase